MNEHGADLTVLGTLVRDLIAAREKSARKYREKVDADEARDEAENALFDYLEDNRIPGIDVELGEGVVFHVKRRATEHSRVLNQDALLEWANENARTEEIFDSKIRKKPLNQLIRSLREQNQDLPDGVDFYTERGITLTNKTKRK
jgi:hypothetical protein